MKMLRFKLALFLGLLSIFPMFVHAQASGSANEGSSGKSGVEMVFVPSGTFIMGCTFEQLNSCAYDEKPAHKVTLRGFAISKYEVTQKLWKEIMGDNPSQVVGDFLPVHNVSWDDVQVFIKRLNQRTGKNYRLPTEAEWEYAARGGNLQGETPFVYSGSGDIQSVAWFYENSEDKPHEVGSKQPNALGLYDMSGNVWEWCGDYYELYSDKAQQNPTGASKGISRVTRGGCYTGVATQCRVTTRKGVFQGNKDATTGFRLALDDDREARAAEAARKAEEERLAAERAAQKERQAAEKAAAESAKKTEQERIATEKAAEQERLAAERAATEAAKKAEQERIAAERAAEQERIAAERAAEQERIAAERAAAEAAKKAEQERIAAEKEAAHQAKVAARKERLGSLPLATFLTLNTAYTSMPQWSYGFKVGTVRVVGWYFSAMTNFNYKGAFSPFKENQHYELTGSSKTTYLEGQLGLVIRPCRPLSIHIGAGFAYRTLNYESDDGWHYYPKRNYYGPTASFGFMFHIKGFVISAEATGLAYNLNPSNSTKYAVGARAGIGFCLPDKKKENTTKNGRKE